MAAELAFCFYCQVARSLQYVEIVSIRFQPIIDHLNAKMPENILSSRSNNFFSQIYDRMHQIVRYSYNADANPISAL